MVIDQRNAGASVTPTNNQYLVDRFLATLTQASKFTVQQNAGSVTPPVGFTKYLGVTSSSAYSVLTGDTFGIVQYIEGFNIADLAWGTANAKTVTLSFQVYSSLTGTFGGALVNGGQNRSYPFSYTVSSANTWTQISVTVAGDTTGTWATDNSAGLGIRFGLGSGATYSGTSGAWAAGNYVQPTSTTSVVGTNGATFYITGVQLEAGSTASPFEYRQYGTELALCQRYYYRMTQTTAGSGIAIFANGFNISTTVARGAVFFPVTMRSAPSALEQNGTAANYRVMYANSTTNCSSVPVFQAADVFSSFIDFTVASGLTAGQGSMLRGNTNSPYLGWSAEL